MTSHLKVVAHPAGSYPPRTRYNASLADLTVAFAIDFSSPGERLTRTAAASRYVAIHFSDGPAAGAATLISALRDHQCRTLNVAGHSLQTLLRHGVSESACNEYVHRVLSEALKVWPVGRVVSGGQTGVDLAGAVSASVLGIEAELTLPAGFLQRDAQGRDAQHTEAEIREHVAVMAEALRVAVDPLVEREAVDATTDPHPQAAGSVRSRMRM